MIFGYLDPGSGSMILQAILGGMAGLVVAMKMFGRRMWSFLTFWRRDREPEEKTGRPPETEST